MSLRIEEVPADRAKSNEPTGVFVCVAGHLTVRDAPELLDTAEVGLHHRPAARFVLLYDVALKDLESAGV